jgi:deoxyuridine 5'-triphosphate nucleotidohydrolase
MPILPYREKAPDIAPGVFIAETAVVTGEVTIGEESSLWYGVVVRGDAAPVRIGRRTNVQDGAIIHSDPDNIAQIGDACTLGHGAIVHGAVLENGCLVGIGAIVLNGARIGEGSIIGSGAVVAERQQIPPRSLVLGVPGKVVRQLTPGQAVMPERASSSYTSLGQEYRSLQERERVGLPSGVQVAYRRLDDGLPAFTRSHQDDAGADLIAMEDQAISCGETVRIGTNLAIALPVGFYGIVSGRSGQNLRGILCHVGTIDTGFRGQISVALTNLSADIFTIRRGDRIAQLTVVPFALPHFAEAQELPQSQRGERGWGSSGR